MSIIDAVIPPPYQFAVKVIIVVLLAGGLTAGGYLKGRADVQDKWDLQQAKDDKEIAELKEKQGSETVKVVTKYVDRVKIVKEKGETVVQYVDRWITPEADAGCKLPDTFVVLHDSAAKNTVPDAAGDPNARTDSGVKLSAATKTITGNYGTCYLWKEQVIGLQEWIKAQQKLNPAK